MVKLEKIIRGGLYLLFLLPLVFTSRTMYPWHFGKTVLFQALVEILVVLAIVYYFERRTSKENLDIQCPKWNLLDYLIILFLAIQIISSIFGVNFTRSFWGDQQRAQGVFTLLHFAAFYFLLKYFFTTKKDWQWLGVWILIVAVISSILAWIGPHLAIFANVIDKNIQLNGLIGNPIFFAGYLIIPLFLGFVLFFLSPLLTKERADFGEPSRTGGIWRRPILIASIFLLLTFLFAQSRGAFIGFMAGAFVVWLVFLSRTFLEHPIRLRWGYKIEFFGVGSNTPPQKVRDLFFGKNAKAKKIFLISGIALIFLAAGLYVFNQKSDYLKKNFPPLSRLFNISSKETTASTRLMAWQIALRAWRDKPILGWGPENYEDAFDRHYNPNFLKYSFAETVWDKPHSYPLEILSASGAAGFLIYLAIIISAFVYLIKIIRRREDAGGRFGFIILIGALTAYVIQSSFAFETSNSLQLWMFLLAFISFSFSNTPCIASFLNPKYPKDPKNPKHLFFDNTKKNIGGIISFLALLFLLSSPYFLYKNYTFYKASVLMGGARDAAEIGSVYLWQKAAAATLNYPAPFLWEQAVFLTKDLANIDKAGKLDKKTLDLVSPKLIEIFNNEIKKNHGPYTFRFWLSQLYSFMGEYVDGKYYDEANKILGEAREFSPERQHIPLLMAKNYLLQKKTDEGIKVLTELVNKDSQFAEPHWFLGLALTQAGREEEGIKELEQGAPFGVNSKGNVLYLIDLYAKRKEYDKIIPLYKKLIELEPRNASYYASLAATYAALGDRENVIININKAVELNPALAEEAKIFLEQNSIK